MIVVYSSFRIGADDSVAFEEWLQTHMDLARHEQGCVVYDYLLDPRFPERGTIVEVWQSPSDLELHAVNPAYIERRALGTLKWKMSDLRVRVWPEAGSCRESVRATTHERVAGREASDDLVAAYARAHLPEAELEP
jgi:quinol monooxygenase YgiN